MGSRRSTTRTCADIDRGVALTLARAPYDVDYACCGNVGLHDFLISAGRRLDRPDLHDAAMRGAKRVVLRARAEDSYALDPLLPRQIANPTFFQGMSGIGYTLLRCARPGAPLRPGLGVSARGDQSGIP